MHVGVDTDTGTDIRRERERIHLVCHSRCQISQCTWPCLAPHCLSSAMVSPSCYPSLGCTHVFLHHLPLQKSLPLTLRKAQPGLQHVQDQGWHFLGTVKALCSMTLCNYSSFCWLPKKNWHIGYMSLPTRLLWFLFHDIFLSESHLLCIPYVTLSYKGDFNKPFNDTTVTHISHSPSATSTCSCMHGWLIDF